MTVRQLLGGIVAVVICAALVGTVAGVVSERQAIRYDATASLLFGAPRPELLVLGADAPASTTAEDAATDAVVVGSQDVADATAARLGLARTAVRSAVEVAQSGQTSVVDVTAGDASPAQAARLANAYVDTFRDRRLALERSNARQAIAALQGQLAALPVADKRGPQGQTLRQQIASLSVLDAVNSGSVQVSQRATAPTSPAAPQTRRNVLYGALVGVVLGLGIASVWTGSSARSRALQRAADAPETVAR